MYIQVFITQLIRDGSDPNGRRDYSKEAVEFFQKKLDQYGNAEVPIKSLLGHRSQAPPEIRHVSGQHSREFKEFLCRHSDVFVVQDDYVVLQSVLDKINANGDTKISLTRMPEEIPFDPYLTQQFIATLENELMRITPQYSSSITVDILFNHLKNNCQNELWASLIKNTNDLITFLRMNLKIFHVQSNIVSLTPEREQQRLKQMTNSPPPPPPQLSSPPSSNSSTPVSSPSRVNSASSINQRLRSQIMKIVTDNSMIKYKNLPYSSSTSLSSSSMNSTNEATLLRNSRIITKTKEGDDIINDIFKNHNVVSFDCEGINLGASGQITLIQIAVMPPSDSVAVIPKIYIFDILLNPEFLNGSLKELLESEKIIKVIHDARNDSSALFFQYGIKLANIFDTQVSHAVIQQQNTGRPAYKAKYVSLNMLLEMYGGPASNPKKEQMKKFYRKDQKYWSHRPLTDEMVYYAAFDVYALVPDVYCNMSKQIRQEYLPLLQQLNHEAIYSKIDPIEIKQRKKQRKIDMEVNDLKLKLINSEAKQIVLSNREIRLLRYQSISIDFSFNTIIITCN